MPSHYNRLPVFKSKVKKKGRKKLHLLFTNICHKQTFIFVPKKKYMYLTFFFLIQFEHKIFFSTIFCSKIEKRRNKK